MVFCALLAYLAQHADEIVVLLLRLVERIINTLLQFLLRRVLLLDKLQAGIDMAVDACPNPSLGDMVGAVSDTLEPGTAAVGSLGSSAAGLFDSSNSAEETKHEQHRIPIVFDSIYSEA